MNTAIAMISTVHPTLMESTPGLSGPRFETPPQEVLLSFAHRKEERSSHEIRNTSWYFLRPLNLSLLFPGFSVSRNGNIFHDA